ncbi:D-hexose-6-phosphate mutarotase [Enterovibrio sp. ZSDZ42]|uniref:Putative glucose-6-phosphate 1-epimerase n=1 Tax=Enterovibrio gelatinilyticus TaxID=2899819 RepID=A0ABT5R295_9GAMM|nr:D-hexose-6-phosphate mutarotase [Enterovibrio sp. ZSDZ42]MDD1794280.1 D-hexose-6-phosphate mutarotase [Enterovibrio sp. ZSDZ42]
MDVNQLPTTAVLSDYVTVCELDGIKVLRVIHPKATATISLFGAHVLSFQPSGKKDVIWMSEKADFSGNKAIRGGIPVCWPWFGKAAEPSHGFARSSEWTLNEHRENENGVIISLTLADSPDTHDVWPHAFHAEIIMEVGDTLKVGLVSTNTGNTPILVGGALHTYLNIGDISKTTVSQLGNEYIAAGVRHPSGGNTEFDQEVDRIYTHAEETVVVEDLGYQRRLTVTNHGHNAVVVWNPWKDLSISMGDMADNSYETMVCVESAVHDRSVSLEAGDKHILSTVIACQ